MFFRLFYVFDFFHLKTKVKTFINLPKYFMFVQTVFMLTKKYLLIGLLICQLQTLAQPARRYDIVIHEIMADPSPAIALPGNEWIELRNTSLLPINLAGWRISDATSTSGPMPNYILAPDSMVIVCTSSAVAAMSVYGATIAVTSFPSLDNTGDLISIRSPQNTIIHAVNYSDAWYQSELKKDGGWTLEMIDSKNPCTGYGNWIASTDLKGGSPGKKNAVAAIHPDNDPPQLLRAFAVDNFRIILSFNEPLDSALAVNNSYYSISDGIGNPVAINLPIPVFDKVQLQLSTPLLPNKIYTITVRTVKDCVGNSIGSGNTVRVGLAKLADTGQIIINEILFNPRPQGTDYVELYNRSNSIIDLKQLFIANRNSSNQVSNIKPLSTDNYLIFPQDLLVFTENPQQVLSQYVCQSPASLLTVTPLPSFNDDKGNVILLNAQGIIIDELAYEEQWHFKLINNNEGIALERISYQLPTGMADNWHSAASSVGYGTPTYKNSQANINEEVKGELSVSPEIISPDNDGFDDYAIINYRFPTAGYVANCYIYDASGRLVRYLLRNALCGTAGSFSWDGLGEKNQSLPAGIYILYAEVFNLQGKKKRFKLPIVVAHKK